MKNMDGKNVSVEEQKKFLQSKMTEEEIAEVYRRINEPKSE